MILLTVVISTGTLRTVVHGMPILLAGQHHSIYTHSRKDLQERDEERIPELLSASKTRTGAGEATLGVNGIGGADVDPDECDGGPTSETVVALEDAEGVRS